MQHTSDLTIPQSLEEILASGKVALIVYDMQIGVLNQIRQKKQLIKQVTKVLTAARKAYIRTFFFRHLSLPKEIMGVSQYRMAMTWQKADSVDKIEPWFLRDSKGFQLTPELAPQKNEVIFDKITMSAFEGTPLNMVLRDCEINAFIIVGVAMEIGIEPTIRHGVDLGYIPILVTDACGTGDQSASKRSTDCLDYSGDTILTNIATICNLLEQQREGKVGINR